MTSHFATHSHPVLVCNDNSSTSTKLVTRLNVKSNPKYTKFTVSPSYVYKVAPCVDVIMLI